MSVYINISIDKKAITKIHVAVIIAVIAIATIGVGVWYATRPPEVVTPIKIGFLLPLSPPGCYTDGRMMLDAGKLAVDEINKAGGVLGRPIEIISYDSKGLPEEGVSAIKKLILEHKVVAAVGFYHSSVTLAAIEIAKLYNTPVLVSAAWADEITAKRYKNVFKIAPWTGEASERLVAFLEWLTKTRPIRKIAVLAETTDYGVGQVNLVKSEIEKKGLPIEFIGEFFEYGATDLTPQLMKLKELDIDVLVNAAAATPSCHLMPRQGVEIGLHPKALHVVAWGSPILPDFWEVAGEAGVGVAYLGEFHPAVVKTDWGVHFVREYEKTYGITPPYYASLMYDNVRVLADAIKRAGSTDPDAIIEALRKTSLEGIYGTITFETVGTEGPIYQIFTKHPFVICQYQKYNVPHEESVIIWPPDLATGGLI